MNTATTSSVTYVHLTIFNSDGITYLVTSASTVKIIPNKNRFYTGAVIIPTTVTYKGIDYIVTKIGVSAFANNYDLNSITIPSTITSIEENAFANNFNLVEVICNSTTPLLITKTVFENISKNCKLIVPTASLSVYKTADIWNSFQYITNVLPFTVAGISYEKTSETTVKVIKNLQSNYTGSITIPATVHYNNTNYNVTEVSATAFVRNKEITAIYIGSNITAIEAFTFSENKSLTSVSIANSVTTIGDYAFQNCTSLTTVTLPKSIISIGNSAFENCTNLSSIIIPNSVTSIGDYAFSKSGLTSFRFPSSMTTINIALLNTCEKLATVTIPSTITTIKDYSLAWCPNLTSVICNIKSPLVIDTNVFSGTDTNSCALKVPKTSLNNYKTAKVWNKFGIVTNVLPFTVAGITYEPISDTAVKVVKNLTNNYVGFVSIPKTVVYNNITYSVTVIGTSAFANNNGLEKITIPESITFIEEHAFSNNSNLSQLICNIKTPLVLDTSIFNGTILSSCKLVVPSTSLALYNTASIWKNFNTITDLFPFTIANIAYEPTSTTTVQVIKNTENYYKGSITIPETVTYNNTIYSVTEISETAFKNNKNITAISLGDNITSIKAFTFYNCKNLSFITMSNSVTAIGKSAFSASGLTSFTFPSAVTTIETYLFISCEKLCRVTIPSNITTIKEYSFGWCPKLTTLFCDVEVPLTLNSNVFSGTNTDSCALKVPAESLDKYKKADVWKNFSHIAPSTQVYTPKFVTKNNMSVYPDFIQDNLFIDFNDSNEATVEIFNANGQVLFQKTKTCAENSINTSNLPIGMYWVKLTSNKGIITKKIIKK